MVSYKISSVVRSRLNLSPEDEVETLRDLWTKPPRNWSPLPGPLYVGHVDVPLLRTWDKMSGSQPHPETGHMFARDSEQRLHTAELRRDTLELHLNHRNWAVPTPYISFQVSEQSLQELANLRRTRLGRARQIITVIDPEVRLSAGWPVVCVGQEMRYYGLDRDCYDKPPQVHDDHYVCLWRVENEEIVNHWDWDGLSRVPDWYNKVILPALRQFRRERRQREQQTQQQQQQQREMERQQELASSQVEDILPAMSALGLDDTVAGPSSSEQPYSQSTTNRDEQLEPGQDSGIGSEDESESESDGENSRAVL
ncbi:hypothetical protein ACHAPT_000705 [Fusarium lateritium]